MPVDPSPIIACAATWRPRPTWARDLRAPHDALVAGATGLDAMHAWANVAMMMGDTRGAPLALVVCLHAESLLPNVEDRRLAAHRHLCMLDLGLATAPPGPIPIATLGEPTAVTHEPASLAAWTERALVPFHGDLAAAAWFCLRLAAVRTGLIEGPEPTVT